MKRILLISPMPPWIGGVSISTQRLYENLKKDKYNIDVYKLKFDNPKFNNKLCIIVRFFFIPFYILFHNRYDIIHCHVPGIYSKLYLGISRFLFKKSKLIFTIHGDITTLLNKKLSCFTLNRADKIICVQMGDSQKTPIKIRHKCIDIPAFILPNHITEENIPDNVLQFVKKKTFPLIIFNGAIVLSKTYYDLYGFEDTINTYIQLKKENIQCRLLMLINNKTTNKDQRKFIDKIKQKILNDPLTLIIENGEFELLPLFNYATIYLRPTKTDGDSLSVREAIAMNCYVIASDRAQRPEGTIIYHTNKELFDNIKRVLHCKKITNRKNKTNFYDKIVEQYEIL